MQCGGEAGRAGPQGLKARSGGGHDGKPLEVLYQGLTRARECGFVCFVFHFLVLVIEELRALCVLGKVSTTELQSGGFLEHVLPAVRR